MASYVAPSIVSSPFLDVLLSLDPSPSPFLLSLALRGRVHCSIVFARFSVVSFPSSISRSPPPIRTLLQPPPTTTLHDHGIRPEAAPVSTLTHLHVGGSANRRSCRRKDGGVTRDSSPPLVVPRHVPLLYNWDDYLAAGALSSMECSISSAPSCRLPLVWGFLTVVQVGKAAAQFSPSCLLVHRPLPSRGTVFKILPFLFPSSQVWGHQWHSLWV